MDDGFLRQHQPRRASSSARCVTRFLSARYTIARARVGDTDRARLMLADEAGLMAGRFRCAARDVGPPGDMQLRSDVGAEIDGHAGARLESRRL